GFAFHRSLRGLRPKSELAKIGQENFAVSQQVLLNLLRVGNLVQIALKGLSFNHTMRRKLPIEGRLLSAGATKLVSREKTAVRDTSTNIPLPRMHNSRNLRTATLPNT
ncbi:hypothetical protein ACFWB5_12740, partial [Corynebacterium xerosis]|uniref:hypothetical protein n=1 Tax=Corynebacterium xerosis TaxID=1725 RepID=UPI0036623D2E